MYRHAGCNELQNMRSTKKRTEKQLWSIFFLRSQLPVSAAGANADVVLLGRRLVRHRLRVGSAGPAAKEQDI